MKLTLFVSIEAKPGPGLQFEDSPELGGKQVGYFQTLGITARSQQELLTLIRDHLKSQWDSVLVNVEEMWQPDFEGRDQDIRDLCRNMNDVGIWYSSGRAFFPDDAEESEDA
jgi:hypothetical protein